MQWYKVLPMLFLLHYYPAFLFCFPLFSGSSSPCVESIEGPSGHAEIRGLNGPFSFRSLLSLLFPPQRLTADVGERRKRSEDDWVSLYLRKWASLNGLVGNDEEEGECRQHLLEKSIHHNRSLFISQHARNAVRRLIDGKTNDFVCCCHCVIPYFKYPNMQSMQRIYV